MRIRTAGLLAVAGLLLAGCDDDRVRIAFEPEVDRVYEYRYAVESTTARVLDDQEPVRNEIDSVIEARHTVQAVDDGGVDVEVELRRDADVPRTFVVRFDRSAQLVDIELVDGVALGSLGEPGVRDLLTGAVGGPPARLLAPGDTWEIDGPIDLPGTEAPVDITGVGRLVELGEESGGPTATVETVVRLPVAGRTDDDRTSFVGEQVTEATVTYDLRDGSVVAGSARTRGEVDLRIQPPVGVVGAPVAGLLSYELSTSTARTGVDLP